MTVRQTRVRQPGDGLAPGAPARVRLELIDPDSALAAAHDGGLVYIRIPREGYALGWRVGPQEGRASRR